MTGLLIGRYRRMLNISQHTLGEQTGLSQAIISRIEKGERPVTTDELKLIASALQVSEMELLYEKI